MVGQVAELQQEQARRLGARDGVAEGRGVAMHVGDDAEPLEAAAREVGHGGIHHAAGSAASPSAAKAASARLRPSAWSITGRG